MHNCLEGCVQYEVKELLRHFNTKGILSVTAINNAIHSFRKKIVRAVLYLAISFGCQVWAVACYGL